MRGTNCECSYHRIYRLTRDSCAIEHQLFGSITHHSAHDLARALGEIDRKCPNA